MSQIFFFLASIVFVVEEIVYLIKGKVNRRLSADQVIVYEGAFVRILSLLILILGVISGLGALRIISVDATLNLWLLILVPSIILAVVIERNGFII